MVTWGRMSGNSCTPSTIALLQPAYVIKNQELSGKQEHETTASKLHHRNSTAPDGVEIWARHLCYGLTCPLKRQHVMPAVVYSVHDRWTNRWTDGVMPQMQIWVEIHCRVHRILQTVLATSYVSYIVGLDEELMHKHKSIFFSLRI